MATNKKTAPNDPRVASRLHGAMCHISILAWRMEYSLEEARQSHEANGRHFRRLICCIGQAALRVMTGGLHHV